MQPSDTPAGTAGWVTRAACRHHDPDLWTLGTETLASHRRRSAATAATITALQVCWGCPVIDACREDFERRRGTRHRYTDVVIAGLIIDAVGNPFPPCAHCQGPIVGRQIGSRYCSRSCADDASRRRAAC